MKNLFLLLLIFMLLVACSARKGEQVEEATPSSSLILTSSDNYPAAKLITPVPRKDGFLGLVKIFVEHGIMDDEGKTGTYLAQGTGSVFSINGQHYIVTAKHVVIPNAGLKEFIPNPEKPKDKVTLNKVESLGARILLGYTGIEPSSVWIPVNDNPDIAILTIPDDKLSSLVIRSIDARMGNNNAVSNNVFEPGSDVEVWGYPAKQSPQTQRMIISDVKSEYFVLNQALLQGYSGGLVLLPTDDNTKIIIGMIIRSDDKVNQSTVVPWNEISAVLDGAINSTSNVRQLAPNETVKYRKMAYAFYTSDEFPFISTLPAKWWELWKK